MKTVSESRPIDNIRSSKGEAGRSPRARDLILDTMYRLALEKDFSEITVQDLLARSGVARSTFYAHFRDKEDLLVAGYDSIGLPCTKVCKVSGRSHVVLDVSAWLFSATERHAELTSSFFSGPSQRTVVAHLENILLIRVREHYRQQGTYLEQGVRGEVAVRCFVGALISSWLWWVRHDFPCPAEEMTSTFDALMNSGVWPQTGSEHRAAN